MFLVLLVDKFSVEGQLEKVVLVLPNSFHFRIVVIIVLLGLVNNLMGTLHNYLV